MENPKERLVASISTAELERRWKAARKVMKKNKVDFLIVRNDEEFLGGNVKWFTDLPARHSYPYTVIFPVDEEMTLISVGPPAPNEPGPPAWTVRGVKKRLSSPYFASVHYTGTYDAELAVGVLKEKKGATIGLVGKSFIPITFYEYLKKHLAGYKFVDMTDPIDQIKVIKSPEEIDWIKKTARIQDVAMQQIKNFLKPGRRDFEVHADVLYSVMVQGSERQLILCASGPQDGPVPFLPRHFQNRVIKDGDQFSILIEVNGPGGFYTELSRTFSLGKPSQQLQDAFGAAVEAQKLTVSLLKPGVSPKKIIEANNAFMEKHGYKPERRLYAHGQGYDLVERPLIREDEPMKIKAGMNITVHPGAANASIWGSLCDNYIVTETGEATWIHTTPKEIIVL
jgi:Xaa-Pro aminopeptidase